MILIDPSFELLDEVNGEEILKKIERAGRVCYKSESLIKDGSAEKFIRGIIEAGHDSVIEHVSISVCVICDRGVSHEIVRHRIASYSQESTRYCNYSKKKFGGELTFIKPYYWDHDSIKYAVWKDVMEHIEKSYMTLLREGATAQEARSILPNSLKTELVMTMNLREWRHFFKLRCANGSHPQMTQLTRPMLDMFKTLIPLVFVDINY